MTPDAAVTVEVGHGDAEPHLGAGGGGRVDQDRVEHGAARRVQGVHAVGRLDGDRHDGIGVAERGAAHLGRARRDDLVEQAPPVQLQHAAAHQGVRGEGVGTVAAAVDEEHAQPGAGQQVGGGRPRGTGADDNDVVAGVGRAADKHGLPPGSAVGAGAGAGRGVTAGNVIGHGRGVAADAADEVRTAVVLEALTEHVQARDRRAAAALADLARAVEHRRPQPWVGTPVAGCPHDGADTGGAKVEVRDGAGRGDGGMRSAVSISWPSPLASMCWSMRRRSCRMRWSAAATVAGRSVASRTR
jgi:hypothetical protein